MQPIRIGVSAVTVLVLLLLSVPIQLLLSHLLAGPSNHGDPSNEGETNSPRDEALDSLADTAEALSSSFYSTISYYSSWTHLKELVLVPYHKPRQNKLKTTVFRGKDGTNTVVVSGNNAAAKAGKTRLTGQKNGKLDDASSSTLRETGKPNSRGSGSTTTADNQLNTDKGAHIPQSSSNELESQTPSAQTDSKFLRVQSHRTIAEVSRAREVDEYLMNEVYFSQSKTPRHRRPLGLQFSVGQVVRHRMAEYVGVVTGWDDVAKAPDRWIKQYYENREGVEGTPHYLVLVDSKYTSSGSPYHYVPQEDLELVPGEQIRCPEKSKYFESYNNRYSRYSLKPWLRDRYPRD